MARANPPHAQRANPAWNSCGRTGQEDCPKNCGQPCTHRFVGRVAWSNAVKSRLTSDDYATVIVLAEDALREDERVLKTLGSAASASFTTYPQKKIATRNAKLGRFRAGLVEAGGA